MQKEINHNWHFSQTPEEVWQYLTQPELLEQWLAKMNFQPIVGHKFSIIGRCNEDENVSAWCEVLEVQPYTRLSYSWQTDSLYDNMPFNSKVTWTLIPQKDGTELRLVHNGFTAMEDVIAHDTGWTKIGDSITGLLKTNQNLHKVITVNASPEEAMKKISRIDLWWVKDIEGKTENLNDEFHVPMGTTSVDFQITELVPNKKVVWKVTNSYIPWLKDKSEWNATEVVFEISEKGPATQIDFTHVGLVPGIECYEACEKGWNGHITVSLVKLINEGEGNPRQF